MGTVAILAAGYGKRSGLKYNKALVKIGDKAAISHIIDYFPLNYEFVIALGYMGDAVEQYLKIAHSNRKFTFVETEVFDAGPAWALQQCYHYLFDKPFHLWCCDTIVHKFEQLDEEKNWIGIRYTKNTQDYSTALLGDEEMVEKFIEKGHEDATEYAYIGCAYIKDYEDFWKGLKEKPVVLNGESMVSAGFKPLIDKQTLSSRHFLWFDIGTKEGIAEARQYFKSKVENLNKEDEEIYFINNKVVKFFTNEEVCRKRIERAGNLGRGLVPQPTYFPGKTNSKLHVYGYHFVNGQDLFSISNPQDYLMDLLNFSLGTIWERKKTLEKSKVDLICYKFYKQKTEDRLKLYYKQTSSVDEEETVNGQKLPKLSTMLDGIDWKWLTDSHPCTFHGDFNFSNILLTPENKFMFIDWRQDFGGLTDCGDAYYDLAKMYSGFMFVHDIVKQGKFKINKTQNVIDFSSEIPYRIELCTKIFQKFLKVNEFDEKKVKTLAAIVLLNMSPLHEPPLNVYLYYLGKYLLWETTCSPVT